MTDKRYTKLRVGLDQLETDQLVLLKSKLESNEPMVFDEFNYDPKTDKWWPLAHALGVPEYVKENGITPESDKEGSTLIIDVAKNLWDKDVDLNRTTGVPGSFYREDRRTDLLLLVEDILAERL